MGSGMCRRRYRDGGRGLGGAWGGSYFERDGVVLMVY